jgi:hypothetical protein
MMADVVYVLCAVTSLICTIMLLRGYRKSGVRLLLWSGLCFLGFTLNNIFLVLDFSVYPEVDLSLFRNIPALIGLGLLIFGLVWDAPRT